MLLFKPTIDVDECPVSYLIRVAQANGFKSIGHLLRFAGLPWKNNRAPVYEILTGDCHLEVYFNRLGLRFSPSSTSEVYRTFNRVIDTQYIFVKYPKICPLCVAEEGFCRAQWAYLPILACERHKILLVDCNPKTGQFLSWYRGSLNKFDIVDTEPISLVLSGSREIIKISSLFHSLIGTESLPPSYLPHQIIIGLKFNEVLSLFNFLAHYHGKLLGNKFLPLSLGNLALAENYKSVWAILNEWPDSFYNMLAQYIDKPTMRTTAKGFNRHFSDILERLQRQEKNIGIARIKLEFNRFVQEYWPGALLATHFVRLDISRHRKIVSKIGAARILGCRIERINKYVSQGRLSVTIFNGKSHFYSDEVKRLLDLIVANWTFRETCEALQISRFQLKKLIDAELIPLIQKSDELNRDWIIDKVGAQNLISDLMNRESFHTAGARKVSLAGIQRSGFTIVDLVKKMLSGEIEFHIKRDNNHPFSFKQFYEFIRPI